MLPALRPMTPRPARTPSCVLGDASCPPHPVLSVTTRVSALTQTRGIRVLSLGSQRLARSRLLENAFGAPLEQSRGNN